jgi:DNA-binding transcriptional LysR family regulator
MDLPALRTIAAVADELHFGRAADALGIAQPQVSQRVRKLEDELGLTLFERDNHRVAVTPAGAQVVRHAREVVAAADRLARLADGLREGSTGSVRIGAVGSAFFGAISGVLAPARQALPDVELLVQEMESPEQLDALAAGAIDIGFMRPPAPAGVTARDVWAEPLVVAVPESSPLTEHAVLSPSDLAGQRVVLFPREAGPGYWDRVAALFVEAGVTLQPVAEAGHVTTLLGLVSLGMGITVVPASMQTVQLPGIGYRELRTDVELRLSLVTAGDDFSENVRRVVASIPSLPA